MTDHRPQTSNHQSDGILILDKPADWTSHDVVAKVRKLYNTKRVGHTGTLDPFATGVLVICLNRATRLVQYLTGEDKEYLATIRFGWATDTGDFTGKPLGEAGNTDYLNAASISNALLPFRGRIQQIPPMYSAKKIGGVKLYEMARRGKEIERQPISVEIKELELLEPRTINNSEIIPPPCDFTIRVVCTSGTYIRTLAEDIGKLLGIGAHLIALRRTGAGNCSLPNAVTLEQLALLAESGKIADVLIPMSKILTMPEVQINKTESQLLLHGRVISRVGEWQSGNCFQLIHAGQLLAIAEYNQNTKAFQPRIVFS